MGTYCAIADVRRIMRIASDEDPSDADITKFIEEAEAAITKELGSITADAAARELVTKTAALSITGPDPYTVMMGGITLVIYPSEWMRRIEFLRRLIKPEVTPKSSGYKTDGIKETWEET